MLEDAHALVVGISAYQHVRSLPQSVAQDARAVQALLVDPAYCAYPPENVRLLVDDEAGGKALRGELVGLAARCSDEATLLLYFSCHGARIGQQAYLLPADASYESEQSLAETSLTGDELTRLLADIPARKALVIFDCCHAGGLGEVKAALPRALQAGLPEAYYESLQKGRGRVILASSRQEEVSWVQPGASNSLFTAHLLDGLRGGAASEDGLVRIFDLYEYLQPRVTAAQPQQHPLFKAELEDNFPVALWRGGQAGAIQRDTQGFRYDAYISFTEADGDFVWQVLLPRLQAAGLRVAVSGMVEEPGVALVVGIERAIEAARRTLVVLSQTYLQDQWAEFQNILAQTLGVEERRARLLPLVIDDSLLDAHARLDARVDLRLRMLTPLLMVDEPQRRMNLTRLVETLAG